MSVLFSLFRILDYYSREGARRIFRKCKTGNRRLNQGRNNQENRNTLGKDNLGIDSRKEYSGKE